MHPQGGGRGAYREAALTAILQRHHPDTAPPRREMIRHGLMERANGVYRRTPTPDAAGA